MSLTGAEEAVSEGAKLDAIGFENMEEFAKKLGIDPPVEEGEAVELADSAAAETGCAGSKTETEVGDDTDGVSNDEADVDKGNAELGATADEGPRSPEADDGLSF